MVGAEGGGGNVKAASSCFGDLERRRAGQSIFDFLFVFCFFFKNKIKEKCNLKNKKEIKKS